MAHRTIDIIANGTVPLAIISMIERSRGRKDHGSGSSVEVEVLWKWKLDGKSSLMETEVDGPFGPPYIYNV